MMGALSFEVKITDPFGLLSVQLSQSSVIHDCVGVHKCTLHGAWVACTSVKAPLLLIMYIYTGFKETDTGIQATLFRKDFAYYFKPYSAGVTVQQHGSTLEESRC